MDSVCSVRLIVLVVYYFVACFYFMFVIAVWQLLATFDVVAVLGMVFICFSLMFGFYWFWLTVCLLVCWFVSGSVALVVFLCLFGLESLVLYCICGGVCCLF